MNKLTGISFLKKMGLKTVDIISYENISKSDYVISDGLSIRLSSKKNNSVDVNLPSIHNCFDKEEIKAFYNKHYKEYQVLIHKTIKPITIGSISKECINGTYKIIIEIFENFVERKKGIILQRYIFDFMGEKYLNFSSCNEKKYIDLVNAIKIIPFKSYGIEFIIENEGVLFTDFYTKEIY